MREIVRARLLTSTREVQKALERDDQARVDGLLDDLERFPGVPRTTVLSLLTLLGRPRARLEAALNLVALSPTKEHWATLHFAAVDAGDSEVAAEASLQAGDYLSELGGHQARRELRLVETIGPRGDGDGD